MTTLATAPAPGFDAPGVDAFDLPPIFGPVTKPVVLLVLSAVIIYALFRVAVRRPQLGCALSQRWPDSQAHPGPLSGDRSQDCPHPGQQVQYLGLGEVVHEVETEHEIVRPFQVGGQGIPVAIPDAPGHPGAPACLRSHPPDEQPQPDAGAGDR